jgi:putative glutamine amidotransferase
VTPPKTEGLNPSTDFLGQKAYVDCLVRAGAAPVFLPSVEDDGYISAALAALDGVLLTGGDDADPALYGEKPHPKLGSVDELKGCFEVPLVRGALATGLPIFGICGGIQILNVACGGTLHQDIAACTGSTLQHKADQAQPRPSHGIEITAGTRLHAILGAERLVVNSTHHQALNKLGDGLAVTARAPDGIVEAVERPGDPFVFGVQFHPERLAAHEPVFQRLFDAFVEACTGR